eukprot:RCo033702
MAFRGTVKFFDPIKSFGFIFSPPLKEVYVNRDALVPNTRTHLNNGETVTFDLSRSKGRLSAASVTGLGDGTPHAPSRLPISEAPFADQGTVKWVDANKGFGMIYTKAGEVLFRQRDVVSKRGRCLNKGESVCFDIRRGKKKQTASHIIGRGDGEKKSVRARKGARPELNTRDLPPDFNTCRMNRLRKLGGDY